MQGMQDVRVEWWDGYNCNTPRGFYTKMNVSVLNTSHKDLFVR